MLILFISLLLFTFIFINMMKQYLSRIKIFCRNASTNGKITNIIRSRKNGQTQYKVHIVYNVDGKQYQNNVFVFQDKTDFQIGDYVTIFYDYTKPKYSLAAIDFYSCLRAYQKVIMTITFGAVFMIALRSILTYVYPEKNEIIDILTFSTVGICCIALMASYIAHRYVLSKKQYTTTGIVNQILGEENNPIYVVKYSVSQYNFQIHCSIRNKKINIGDKVTVTYFPKKPFIAEIID